MKLSKSDKLQFIYKGKQYIISIKFASYVFDTVPVYISDSIEDIKVIKLIDESILVIANMEYVKTKGRQVFEIAVLDSLIRCLLNVDDDKIVDMHLTRWLGVNTTMNYIKSIEDVNSERCKDRLSFIEEKLLFNSNFNVHDIQYIINNLKFIDISELEN